MKKFLTILIATVMAFGTIGFAFGCGTKADYNVGIVQLVQHDALDLSNLGFQHELTHLMKVAKKTVHFSDKNANNDQSNCSNIATTLVSKKVDLILAIATPAAQAAATATKESQTPVLFTAVTDAVVSDLVASNDAPGSNVTGVSDINPVEKQIELAKMLGEPVKHGNKVKVGFLYCTKEDNSAIQLKMAKTAAERIDIEIVEQGVSDINDLTSSYSSLVSKGIDVLYIPTDNTIANAVALIKQENAKAKLPIVCGEDNMTKQSGGVATYGIDYYELGRMTARQAFEILVNGKKPSDLPVGSLKDSAPFKLYEDNAAAIGYTIPDSVKALNTAEKAA